MKTRTGAVSVYVYTSVTAFLIQSDFFYPEARKNSTQNLNMEIKKGECAPRTKFSFLSFQKY